MSWPFQKLLPRVVLFLASAFLALGSVELGVRSFLPQFDPSGHVRFEKSNPDLPPLGPPNQTLRQVKNTGDFDVEVRFNRYGFRDSRDIADIAPGDILAVGDSFTFGWGVEEAERYTNQLEALLGRRVFNLSTGGADFQSYRLLLEFGERQGSPQVPVIIGVCMENDLRDYQLSLTPPGFSPAPGTLLQSGKLWLLENSAAYFWMTTVVQKNSTLRSVFTSLGLINPSLFGLTIGEDFERIVVSSAAQLASLCRNRDCTILIVPSRGLWLKETSDFESLVHVSFIERLKELGLVVVDPRAAMEKAGNPLDFYFKTDGHWNKTGHRLAAELLAQALEGMEPPDSDLGN